jgi:hypothetical protein
VFSFLDDDWVFSKSKEQHWTHLEKCVFAVSKLDFLGHRISAAGVAPLQVNVQVILDFPKPPDCKALQRFLGMMNFYLRFLPGTLRPLTAALSGNPKALPWQPDIETTFAAAKAALDAAVPLVRHPPPPGPFFWLPTPPTPMVGQHWQPLGFFSKKLSKTEVNYSTFDRELFAAMSGIKHFQLWTDHKPLIFALNRVSPSHC